MLRLTLSALLLGLTAAPGQALDCENAISQTDMNFCAEQSFRAADAELNQTYAVLIKRATQQGAPDAKALLTAAQRDWLTFRDAECAFQGSGSEGGSIQGMVIVGCREILTRKRTAELKAYLSCREGDASCPVWEAQ